MDVRSALRSHFGHEDFRPGQEPVVDAVLSGVDVLVVMPTGSGKSLGYQLPAVLLPGTTIVVSPLISLMKDQVDELARRRIPAAALHSMIGRSHQQAVLDAGRAGTLRLLYVAPERFASPPFLELLTAMPIARFVIDEAHCVSQWGHDFRPDYRRLRAAAARCRPAEGASARPPIAAFTATATPEVRDDVIELLGLVQPRVLVSGFDRPNIYLRVERVDEDDKDAMLPGLVRGRRALVYTATRKTAEAAASVLTGAGVQASAYHAGLKDAERTRVQDAFANGSLRVVCATNAFGMGIDRPDVDAVVHYAIPGSVEAYYQEIGRAGRDGRQATATLLWSYGDVSTRKFLIDSPRRAHSGHGRGAPLDPAEAAKRKALEHRKLQRMVDYAESTACLRATILDYFGDVGAKPRCDSCGNCRADGIDHYERELLRKILAGVARSGERYGRQRVISMLLGATADLPPQLTSLSTTGLLRHETRDTIDGWLDAAIGAELIEVSKDQYRTLSLTRAGRDVMIQRSPNAGQLHLRRPRQTPPLLLVRRYRRRELAWIRHALDDEPQGERDLEHEER